MSGYVVLSGHLPDAGHFISKRHRVVPFLYDVPHSAKWLALKEWWETDEMIVHVDSDIEVTDELVDVLLECPEALCTFAYELHWASSGVADGVMAQRVADRYVIDSDDVADCSGLGLIKIAPEARIAPLREIRARRAEPAVHKAVELPWHLHWPAVPHHHW